MKRIKEQKLELDLKNGIYFSDSLIVF